MRKTIATVCFYLLFLLSIYNFVDGLIHSNLTWMSYTAVGLFVIAIVLRLLAKREGKKNG